MKSLFFAAVVCFCGSFAQPTYAKVTSDNTIESEVKKNNSTKCSNKARVTKRNSLSFCIKSGYSSGRLSFGDCMLWSFLDYNDDYYKCTMESSGDKFD